MPLPDRSGGQGAARPMPLPDGSEPSFDDIYAQLLAGLNSRIGPEHFALNPDNWTPSTFGSAGPSLPTGGQNGSPFPSYPDPLQSLSALAATPQPLQNRQGDAPDDLPQGTSPRPSISDAPIVGASVAAPALPFLTGLSLADLLPEAGAGLSLPLLAGLGAFLYPSGHGKRRHLR
jgi:hypothetical protein